MNSEIIKDYNKLVVPSNPLNKNDCLGKGLANTASASGSIRNKCQLKPGHSLMHWIRLGQSGKDLTGTGGRKIKVSIEELAKHNTRSDAWLAIRGNVYNVTSYMDFHPGGIEELMRGVGKDATQLFNKIHPWVNYQQLLEKCHIGILISCGKQFPTLIEDPLTEQLNEKLRLPDTKVNIPRFDWMQTSNDLCISVYTKKFYNPGFLLKYFTENNHLLELWVLLELQKFIFKYKLHGTIQWPPKYTKVNTENGKLEVNFIKSERNRYLWPSLGEHKLEKIKNYYGTNDDTNENNVKYLEYQIKENHKFNHDSWQLTLQCNNVILLSPLGYHVNLVNEETKEEKSYTPIPSHYSYTIKNNDDDDTSNDNAKVNNVSTNFSTTVLLYKNYFRVKSFSSYLSEKSVGDMLKVSLPQGNFNLSKLTKHRNICFLAAGSGITPFLGFIDHLLKRETNRIELLYLYYFNKTFNDIWCYKHLKQLSQKENERFRFVPILTRSSELSLMPSDIKWTGVTGHASKDVLQILCNKSFTYVATCGPQGFNMKVEQIIKELKFPVNNFFIFQ